MTDTIYSGKQRERETHDLFYIPDTVKAYILSVPEEAHTARQSGYEKRTSPAWKKSSGKEKPQLRPELRLCRSPSQTESTAAKPYRTDRSGLMRFPLTPAMSVIISQLNGDVYCNTHRKTE